MSVISVSSTAELLNALRNATGGETILLAPGNYGTPADGGHSVLQIQDRSFSSNVIIASADPTRMAHVDLLNLIRVENLTFRSIDFGYALRSGEANWGHQINVEYSSGITFDRVKVHGSLDGDPTNDRNGIGVLNSTRLSVTGSEFFELLRAVQMGSTSHIDVSGNTFHDLRLGGVHFADAQHVRISSNSFTDFFPIGDDHPDAIQFWEAGTTRSNSDILISDNIILQGRGRSLQGIFLGDDVDELVYTDVRIINNLVYIDGWEAIAIEGRARNVLIEDNTAVSRRDDQYHARILLQEVENGLLRDNVTDVLIDTSNGGLQRSNNLFLNDSPHRASDIRGIGMLAAATPESFIISGIGFQMPATTPVNPAIVGTSGNDGFYVGKDLKPTDRIDGREGRDQVGMQGNYVGYTFGVENLVSIESVALLSGLDGRFGDTAGNQYSYSLRTVDANVAAGQTLTVNGNKLVTGEDFIFDGSAETDGAFIIYAGLGRNVLTGGAGDDGFFFGNGVFTADDVVNGGAGRDQIGFRGDYRGGFVFAANTLTSVESLALMSGSDTRFGALAFDCGYNLTLHDATTATGQQLTINGNKLLSHEQMIIDGRAETDGSYRIFGGQGDDVFIGGSGNDILFGNGGRDTLTGGGGADTYMFLAAADSTGSAFDCIVGFDCRSDKIDLPANLSGISAVIDSGRLSTGSFDADLASVLGTRLAASDAVLFTPTSGDFASRKFLVVDGNGTAGYQAGSDYVIELVDPVVPVTPGIDFFV